MPGRTLPKARLHLCGVLVVDGGAAAVVSELDCIDLHAGMKQPEIDIALDLGLGGTEQPRVRAPAPVAARRRCFSPTWAMST